MTNNPKDSKLSTHPPTTLVRVKTPSERVMPPVVYRLSGMDDVTVHSNLKYSDVDNPFLLMDVYTPADSLRSATLSMVMLIHGGASAQYKPKDWGFFQSWGRLIAASGMAAVMFTHRLSYPKPCLKEAALDLSNALNYIRSHTLSLNTDPDRIGLVAWSAGGPLLSPAMQQRPAFVRCLLAFYAYLDIQRSPSHIENESPETLKSFSPISHLHGDSSSMVPFFVARAGKDEIPMMNDSIDRFIAAALTANAPLTCMNHSTGEHGFDNQNDDDRSREIVATAMAFLRTHLGA